ncbi:MAG: YhjD/YihY/BrkB family envelope integrity protein, partial [Myxococcota bacterium]
MQLNNTYKKLKTTAHMFSSGQWDRLHRIELALLYPFWLGYMVIQELIRDRGLVRASALTFTTVLSVVPVVAVATVLLKAFGGTQDTLLRLIQDYLLPFAGPEIINQIQVAVENQVNAAGGIGAIVLIVLGLMLFNNVEHAFNDIWRIKKQRPLLNKFLTFYALITLAPLLVTISIVQTAQFHVMVEAVPFMASLGYKAASIGLAWVLFALANKLLPYTRVNWIPAIVSGLVVALAFELAKTGFNFYVTSFVLGNYQKVYGAIYLIPIFLVWVYICWVIVLFGA